MNEGLRPIEEYEGALSSAVNIIYRDPNEVYDILRHIEEK